jgi:hypothetical protein
MTHSRRSGSRRWGTYTATREICADGSKRAFVGTEAACSSPTSLRGAAVVTDAVPDDSPSTGSSGADGGARRTGKLPSSAVEVSSGGDEIAVEVNGNTSNRSAATASGMGGATVPGPKAGAGLLGLSSHAGSSKAAGGAESAGKTAAISATPSSGDADLGAKSSGKVSRGSRSGSEAVPGSILGAGLLSLSSHAGGSETAGGAGSAGKMAASSATAGSGGADLGAEPSGKVSSGSRSGNDAVPGSMSGAGVLELASRAGGSRTGEGVKSEGKLRETVDDPMDSASRIHDADEASRGVDACGLDGGTALESRSEAVNVGARKNSCVAFTCASFGDESAGVETCGADRLCWPKPPRPIVARLAREAPASPPMASPESSGRQRASRRRCFGGACRSEASAPDESTSCVSLAVPLCCSLCNIPTSRDASRAFAGGSWLSGWSAFAIDVACSRSPARCRSFASCCSTFSRRARTAAGTIGSRSAACGSFSVRCCRTFSRCARALSRRRSNSFGS